MSVSPRLRLAAATAAALAALPAVLPAQACLGFPSFGTNRARGGATVSFGNDITQFGPNIAVGSGNVGAFGGADASVVSFSGGGGTGFGIGANGGIQIPLGENTRRSPSRIQLCPVANVQFILGPSQEGSSRPNALLLNAGAAIGGQFVISPGVSLNPFGSFTGGYQRTSSGGESDGNAGATLTFGSGLTFSERYTPQISVAIPFGFGGGGDPRVFLGFGIGFGQGGATTRTPARR